MSSKSTQPPGWKAPQLRTMLDSFEAGYQARSTLVMKEGNPNARCTQAHIQWALGWDIADTDLVREGSE